MSFPDKALLDDFNTFLLKQMDDLPDSVIREAMIYALQAGGKRVRPLLVFQVLQCYGQDPVLGFGMAAAIEMIHTYSLIHDDMPEMDNDVLRRGKPAVHVQFGQDMALLAGDALQSYAFAMIAKWYEPRLVQPLVALLAEKAGAAGMCLGQELDLASNGEGSLEQLEEIEAYKTGCLLQLSLDAGAILAGHVRDVNVWDEIGREMGIQFQIQDDLLERTSSEEEMGKSLSDASKDKLTALSLFSIEEGQQRVSQLDASIRKRLAALSINGSPIYAMLKYLKERTH